MKPLFLLIGALFAFSMDAAMVRVVGVEDGRTLVVERDGVAGKIRLAGVEVLDPVRAAELLR